MAELPNNAIMIMDATNIVQVMLYYNSIKAANHQLMASIELLKNSEYKRYEYTTYANDTDEYPVVGVTREVVLKNGIEILNEYDYTQYTAAKIFLTVPVDVTEAATSYQSLILLHRNICQTMDEYVISDYVTVSNHEEENTDQLDSTVNFTGIELLKMQHLVVALFTMNKMFESLLDKLVDDDNIYAELCAKLNKENKKIQAILDEYLEPCDDDDDDDDDEPSVTAESVEPVVINGAPNPIGVEPSPAIVSAKNVDVLPLPINTVVSAPVAPPVIPAVQPFPTLQTVNSSPATAIMQRQPYAKPSYSGLSTISKCDKDKDSIFHYKTVLLGAVVVYIYYYIISAMFSTMPVKHKTNPYVQCEYNCNIPEYPITRALDVMNISTSTCNMSDTHPMSSILTSEQISTVTSWLPSDVKNSTVKLLYQMTKDGKGGLKFHSKCDLKGPTITFYISEDGWIFGGYSSIDWDMYGDFVLSHGNFIFSIANPHYIPPTKYVLKNPLGLSYINTAAESPDFGPSLNRKYATLLEYKDTTRKGKYTFTGTECYRVKDILVFGFIRKKTCSVTLPLLRPMFCT